MCKKFGICKMLLKEVSYAYQGCISFDQKYS